MTNTQPIQTSTSILYALHVLRGIAKYYLLTSSKAVLSYSLPWVPPLASLVNTRFAYLRLKSPATQN